MERPNYSPFSLTTSMPLLDHRTGSGYSSLRGRADPLVSALCYSHFLLSSFYPSLSTTLLIHFVFFLLPYWFFPFPLSLSLSLSLSLFLLVGVTVMSYNVLCDKYATRQMYGYCPTWALSWEYRRGILLKEIIDSSADIIALQVCFSCSVHSNAN